MKRYIFKKTTEKYECFYETRNREMSTLNLLSKKQNESFLNFINLFYSIISLNSAYRETSTFILFRSSPKYSYKFGGTIKLI